MTDRTVVTMVATGDADRIDEFYKLTSTNVRRACAERLDLRESKAAADLRHRLGDYSDDEHLIDAALGSLSFLGAEAARDEETVGLTWVVDGLGSGDTERSLVAAAFPLIDFDCEIVTGGRRLLVRYRRGLQRGEWVSFGRGVDIDTRVVITVEAYDQRALDVFLDAAHGMLAVTELRERAEPGRRVLLVDGRLDVRVFLGLAAHHPGVSVGVEPADLLTQPDRDGDAG